MDASHPATEVSPPGAAAGKALWEAPTVSGRPGGGPGADAYAGAGAGAAGAAGAGAVQQIVRYGPGVPGPGAAGGAPVAALGTALGTAGSAAGTVAPTPAPVTVPTAEEVWRHGVPGARRRPARPWWRWVSPVLTVVVLVASAVVIFLRLHHPAFGVTGVAITRVANGCTADVTGRIATTGGAGTVSYEWTFAPQLIAPRVMSQPVATGQTSVYLSATIDGRQHGRLTQTVTLRVLGPGPARAATASAVISC